jgi:hypothetical protein
MSTFKFQGLTAALAATTLAATPTNLAAVPALAQSRSHDAAAPTKLSLNQGRKWATDAPLRHGMSRIRALFDPQLAAAHAGRVSPAQYTTLAGQVETEVGSIVAVAKAVNDYAGHFDHPGFKPIRNVHRRPPRRRSS